MRKLFLKLHLWLSLPIGLILTILCLTGAILTFESEILNLCYPERYNASMAKESRLPLEELVPALKQNLPDSAIISSIQIPANKKKNYRISLAGQGRNSLMVDPYTADIKGEIKPYDKKSFFAFNRRAHRWLLAEYKRGAFSWGKFLTGTSTLICVIILITGVVVWWPKTMKSLKRKLSIKTKAGGFRFWYDTHLAGGMWTLIPLLVMCLTGLTWSFSWYNDGFYKVFGASTNRPAQVERVQQASSSTVTEANTRGDNPERRERGLEGRGQRPEGAEVKGERSGGREGQDERNQRNSQRPENTNYAIWDNVVAKLQHQHPDHATVTVQDGTASIATAKMANVRGADRYTFDKRTGEITGSQLYKDMDKSAKMRGWIYAVHVGSFGGITTKIIYFIACLFGASFPITGYYFYFRRLTRKKKS